MTPQEPLLETLKACGALLEGHFQLSSGLHSDRYFQCARLLQAPGRAEALGKAVAAGAAGLKPDVVVSPALGGLIIGHETAKALGLDFLFTERAGGKMELRRGFELRPGQRVLVVEDVITTGKSSLEVIEIVRSRRGEPVGIAAIVDRGADAGKLGVPVRSLLGLDPKVWRPEECPLCGYGKPAIKPGSRPG